MPFCRKSLILAAAWLIGLAWSDAAARAEAWREPDSPYRLGEAYPDILATCDTVNYWIDHAPRIDARITMGIEGVLSAVEWDGTLAYLIMCEEPGVQVMCVTYSKEGREIGEKVVFGGGYVRAGERRIMLDPCLASPAEE